MPMAPTRKTQFIAENQEQPIHPLYRYAYVSRPRGRADPRRRHDAHRRRSVEQLPRARADVQSRRRARRRETRSPSPGAGSTSAATRGLVIVDIDKPLAAAHRGHDLRHRQARPRIAVQFRYAFVTDASGLHIDRHHRSRAAARRGERCRSTTRAASTSRARTPTSAAAQQGMVIVDVEKPEQPRIDQIVQRRLNDANDVKVASTNASRRSPTSPTARTD